MRADGRENVLPRPFALPRRALAAGAGSGALRFVVAAVVALPAGGAGGAAVAMLAGAGATTAATFAALRGCRA